MNAVLYLRYSPRPQECESLEVQLAKADAYCRLTGLDYGDRIVRDPDVSARKVRFCDRPGGKEVARYIAQGVRHVVAQKLDRVFRNVVDGRLQIEAWEKAGVAMHLVDQGGCTLNLGTATGKLLATTLLMVAEFEPTLTAERTSAGMQHHSRNGRIQGSLAFGFREVDSENGHRMKVEDPDEQAAIARMIELDTLGYSLGAICCALEEEGFENRGNGFNKMLVKRVLSRQSSTLSK